MNIQAAIFDMDGTLIDSLSFWERFWSDFGKTYMNESTFTPPAELDRDIRTMIFSDGVRELRRRLSLPITEEEILAYSAQYLQNFYRHEVKVKNGVIPFLKHLRALGIKCALATATDMKFVRIAVDACGLAEYFEEILSCADIGVGKDRPDIYLLAAERLGASVAATCVVEDSCVALETAQRAGFLTVGIYDKYNFGHDRLRAASDLFVDRGETMETLIPLIQK